MFTLILYVYIQTFSKGDYPALVNAGSYASFQECQTAGKRAQEELPGIGTVRFTCLQTSAK